MALALAVTVGTLACARRTPEPVSSATLSGGEWVLDSLRGEPAVAATRVTLAFADSGVGGYTGCNWYGARCTVRARELRIGMVESTARGCMPPIARQESLFVATLGATRRYDLEDDVLHLEDASGGRLATFHRRSPRHQDPAALRGVTWRAEAMIGRPAGLEGANITMSFGADSVSGHGGCRDYRASYTATGDAMRFPYLSMTDLDCADRAKLLVEQDFTTMLSETSHYWIEGDRLELYTWGGDTLRFHAER